MSTRKNLIIKVMFGLLVLVLIVSNWTPANAARGRVRKHTISLGNQGVKILNRGERAARIEINKVESLPSLNGSKQHFGLIIRFLDAEKRTVQPDVDAYVYFLLSSQERAQWDHGNVRGMTIWFRSELGAGGWSQCPTMLFNGGANGILACRVKGNGTYILGYTTADVRQRHHRNQILPPQRRSPDHGV